MHFETESYLLNQGQGGDAIAVQDDLVMSFDGMSSVEAKGTDTMDEFLENLDQGLNIEQTIQKLVRQQRHNATVAIAKLTPIDQLEIYRVGDSRVRVHDEEGKLVYETLDQNLFAEIKCKLGLAPGFYERSVEDIIKDILELPQVREKFIHICRQHYIEGDGNIFTSPMIRYILEFLELPEMVEECVQEVYRYEYSPTLLKTVFTNSPFILSYSLSVPESVDFAKPVATLDMKPGYRVIVGTDGIFAHLSNRMISEIIKLKNVGFALRGLVSEASRRSQQKIDISRSIATLASN